MDLYFRRHPVEEGERNIILQNRCGNRCTLLFFKEHAEAELLYKPNACRRKDYRARNFSNRDIYTTLFRQFVFPNLACAHLTAFEYDPFVTRFSTQTPSMARNTVTVVNLADENMFAIAARSPLVIGVKPRIQFEERNGLLTDRFSDRGEEIVSFIRFPGYEQNRYRILDDGTHVLQIFENEVVFFGAEENSYQVDRALRSVEGLGLPDLVRRNEELIAPALSAGRISVADPDFQQVVDLNRRIVYSGMDEGGACYGALNRIYMLIWVRDGAMTTSLLARAGNPDFLKTFAPFLLQNPSVTRTETGTELRQFQQILGSRWTKNEDDGIFYAMLTVYSHFVSTGDDSLLLSSAFAQLLSAVDGFLDKAWEMDKGLIGSDTRGESPLLSNPYFGYDAVNGSIESRDALEGGGQLAGKRIMSRCYSLYNTVNTYNLLCMARMLLRQRADLAVGRAARYAGVSDQIRNSIRTKFVDPDGHLYAEFVRYNDGTEQWVAYGEGIDYWEYAWATSLGPFFPAPELQLRSAFMVHARWLSIRTYGFCPWNTMAAMMCEHGMKTGDFIGMLRPEIRDALACTEKFPMQGALGEYIGKDGTPDGHSWRALPFTAGSLVYSLTGTILKALPMGLAVRAGAFVTSTRDFRNQLSRITACAEGDGECVASWSINGEPVDGTLQIPQSLLRAGGNDIRIKRTMSFDACRLHSSNSVLVSARRSGQAVELVFDAPLPFACTLENYSAGAVSVRTEGAHALPKVMALDGTRLSVLETDCCGQVTVTLTT